MIEFAIPETVTLPLSFSNRLPFYIMGDDVLSRHLFLLFLHDALSRHLVLIDLSTHIDYLNIVIAPTETESETEPRPGQPTKNLCKW